MPDFATPFAARPGFARMFRPGALTLGLLFPIESYDGPVPRMAVDEQVDRARLAEAYGFTALWARDVPLLDPTFGDAGQMYDPYVWLTHIAAHTSRIGLATGSSVLPLRNPIDVAKAAASVDLLSVERLVLGIATGDRGAEFPAYGLNREDSGDLFRASVEALRRLWAEDFPPLDSMFGTMRDVGLLPKPVGRHLPLLVTGNSRQSLQWIARHADGWLTYPRAVSQQQIVTASWRQALQEAEEPDKPFAQSLYIDLAEDANAGPTPIHLGFRSGHNYLIKHLNQLRDIGVNHVLINLKYGRRPVDEVLQELAEAVVPRFGADYPLTTS
ncbi:LLM class oxidoreductase [Sphaerimonospora thailandensis]|uniref:N5,N10-methylene tetrahydromethanopterin reductase n=1 Tax=Sphaerimonospora thailandensis TaxID=795644 RepID=A0A8J3RCY6_9ACTN|nr:LLM class oxidoreductase [Sphaerimonospora thailandensis]GIH72490.1 N5,N10-methylene tetrahydromethanopterin reductase [Sphaerimonospora thailandensis]